MIKEISKLIGVSLPFDNDRQLKTYIEEINTVGYVPKILEKDFYLTALLGWISNNIPDISFKGGICLNKIHFPYFRLSEDLDFSRPIGEHGRSALKHFAHDMDDKMKIIATILGRELIAKHGSVTSNIALAKIRHTHLKYMFSYTSVFGDIDTIKVELSYTTKQYLPSVFLPIQHIYNDIVFEESIFPETYIQCISLDEMIAEKTRAALTRDVPVIRDFYDLRFLSSKGYDLNNFLELIRKKYKESDNCSIESFYYPDYPEEIIQTLPYLSTKIETDLYPVLPDSKDFDLPYIYGKVVEVQRRVLEGFE